MADPIPSEVALIANRAGVPAWIGKLEVALHPDYWEGVLWSFAIALAALGVGRLVAWVLHALASRWARMTATRIDDVVVKHLSSPISWLFPLLALKVALPGLELGEGASQTLRQILVVAIILTIGWFFFRIVRVIEEALGLRLTVDGAIRPEARGNYTQLQGFRNIAGFLIGLVSLGLALLSFTGVRQIGASMLASAGVAGVVLGFAAQRSIAAVFSGLVLAIAQPIRIEDTVVVEGESGVIEEVTLTYVVVRLSDFRRIVLPVNYFLEKPFENWSRGSPDLMGRVTLFLDYAAPVEAIREELRRVLETSPHWDKRSWALHVTDATDKAIVLRAQMSAADSTSAFELRCEVREKLVAIIKEKYEYALPTARNTNAQAQAASLERSAPAKAPIDG